MDYFVLQNGVVENLDYWVFPYSALCLVSQWSTLCRGVKADAAKQDVRTTRLGTRVAEPAWPARFFGKCSPSTKLVVSRSPLPENEDASTQLKLDTGVGASPTTPRWRFSRCARWNSGNIDSHAWTLGMSRKCGRRTETHGQYLREWHRLTPSLRALARFRKMDRQSIAQVLDTLICSYLARSCQWSTQPKCKLSS